MYPDGYGTRMVTLTEMFERHGTRMHPEFARRFFAYIEHKAGLLGVGGGWRSTQPDKPGFAPDGKSFHQTQWFASGVGAYAAVDLVVPTSSGVHRSPTWAECADAPAWGLHTFISGEPWHIQCIEMRGWQTWVNAGRPDPQRILLPGEYLPPIPPPQHPDDGGPSMFQKMIRLDGQAAVFACYSGGYKTWVPDMETYRLLEAISGRAAEVITFAPEATMKATGPIMGPIPPGCDAWGNPK